MKIRTFAVFLAAAIVLTTILCACRSIASQASTTSLKEVHRGMMEYIDPETGVHYLCWDWEYGDAMSVRYNADGTIMVTEVSE